MPKVKIRAVNSTGYWVVDQAEHKKQLDEYKQKMGWVAPTEVQKLQQAGLVVPAHMLSEPILVQKPGKFIPADETEVDLTDEEFAALKDDKNVLMVGGPQDKLTPQDQDRIKRQQEAERMEAESKRQKGKHE